MDSDFQDHLLESYSETELIGHILGSPRFGTMPGVLLLSTNLIAKHYDDAPALEDALKAMHVARQLGIRVLCVRRTIQSGHNAWCIMERILGSTLENAWRQLS